MIFLAHKDNILSLVVLPHFEVAVSPSSTSSPSFPTPLGLAPPSYSQSPLPISSPIIYLACHSLSVSLPPFINSLCIISLTCHSLSLNLSVLFPLSPYLINCHSSTRLSLLWTLPPHFLSLSFSLRCQLDCLHSGWDRWRDGGRDLRQKGEEKRKNRPVSSSIRSKHSLTADCSCHLNIP